MNLQAALKNDGSKPALCHTVGWDGSIADHITLDLVHPATPGVPVLFVGESYIRRNDRHGCVYRPNEDGATARVRRAVLYEVPGRTIRFLREPSGGESPHLVHVVLSPPENVTVKRPFGTGVETARIVESSKHEFLLELNPGASANVFLMDGRVVRLTCRETVAVEALPFEQQANLRIARGKAALFQKNSLAPDPRMKREDGLLHELLSVLEIAGKLSEPIRVGLLRDLREVEKVLGTFRPNVQKRLDAITSALHPAKPRSQTIESPETALGAAFAAALKKAGRKRTA